MVSSLRSRSDRTDEATLDRALDVRIPNHAYTTGLEPEFTWRERNAVAKKLTIDRCLELFDLIQRILHVRYGFWYMNAKGGSERFLLNRHKSHAQAILRQVDWMRDNRHRIKFKDMLETMKQL